jgi:hypothetical protein
MADALKEAPLTKEPVVGAQPKTNEEIYLALEFDPNKKYMFELAGENAEREMPVVDARTNRVIPQRKFKPFQNIVLSSQIVWNKQRRNIRYYDGCESIFVDEQPKDKEQIDQLIKQTKKHNFNDGKFGVFGYEKMLLLYLNICSWNIDSPFRTKSADGLFKNVNAEKVATIEASRLDLTEQALKLAKEASDVKMRIHASYLGVPTMDWDSGNELTEKEIRTEYRKEALANPDNFIKSYTDKSLEVKYFVSKALEQGLISNQANPNKVAWSKSGTVICDISGLKSNEAIVEKLVEFSQLAEGEEFVIQLKSIYK